MGIDLSKNNFDALIYHVGHDIQCVVYGDEENVAIECHTCNVVLLDYDNKGDELKESLINLIEEYRTTKGSLYVHEEYLNYWSKEHGVADDKGEYSLLTLNEILDGEYTAELYQETLNSDYEVKFTKVI